MLEGKNRSSGEIVTEKVLGEPTHPQGSQI